MKHSSNAAVDRSGLSEYLRQTVKVEKFELPDAALPEIAEGDILDESKKSGTRAVVREAAPLASTLESRRYDTASPPLADTTATADDRAGKIVAAAMWILAAAIVAALWFATS